ncbi:MAG: HAMP domain-containing sensor histidine kinase [Luteolibacter sp.]
MKHSRGWWIWAALAVCAFMVFGAMTWLTRSVLQSETHRLQIQFRADEQERMRLALWRMDSLGAALLLEESQRPPGESATRLPVRTRFELKNGQLTTSAPDLQSELKQKLPPSTQRSISRPPSPITPPPVPEEQKTDTAQKRKTAYLAKDEAAANYAEKINRSKAVEETLQRAQQPSLSSIPKKLSRAEAKSAPVPSAEAAAPPIASAPAENPGVGDGFGAAKLEEASELEIAPHTGPIRVAWADGALFLLRPIFDGQPAHFEGAWIDVPALQKLLLAETRDLLTDAEFSPAINVSDSFVLASFPFRLDLRSRDTLVPVTFIDLPHTTRFSLALGWFAALFAIATTALLVRGIMRLSERRASFVSAVTHELRTPLTTFRLYSDMLESGAVKEEKRGPYLRVLSREADRLAHLVENVLAFSRIERGSARSVITETTTAALLEPLRDRFETRLAAAGLSLEMNLETAGFPVKVDTAAVEHILFNLIDNAAKYAANSTPPVVVLSVSRNKKSIEIRVSDHGPGIPPAERRRIFRAFHKSARAAAESAPGVGLGLALSRRLARQIGGNLRYDVGETGACFVLTLK